MQTVNFKFKLGTVVKEKITGFTGVIMSQCNYISGCIQYGVMPQKLTSEGETSDWTYYDENRLAPTGDVIDLEEKEEPETPIGGEDITIHVNSSFPRNS